LIYKNLRYIKFKMDWMIYGFRFEYSNLLALFKKFFKKYSMYKPGYTTECKKMIRRK